MILSIHVWIIKIWFYTKKNRFFSTKDELIMNFIPHNNEFLKQNIINLSFV